MTSFESIQSFSAQASSRDYSQRQFTNSMSRAGVQADTEEGINWLDTQDVLAPIRGIEGFFQGIYQTTDWLLGDSLPDFWDDRFLGESKSVIGGFAEGMTTFLAGFIPVAGVFSKGAQFGRVARGLAKVGQKAKLPGADKLRMAMLQNRRVVPTFLQRVKVDTAAGAVVDFGLYDGHEKRLSNLLREEAGLDDPVTEFLAADEDDLQVVARLKGALEGAGFGILADSFLTVLGRLRAARKSRQEGKSPEAMLEADQEALREAQIEEALRRDKDADERKGAQSLPPDERPDEMVFDESSDLSPTVTREVAGKVEALDKKISEMNHKIAEADTDLERAKLNVKRAELISEYEGIVRADNLRVAEALAVEDAGKMQLVKVPSGQNYYEGEIGGTTVRIRKNPKDRKWYDIDNPDDPLTGRDGNKTLAARRMRERMRSAGESEGLQQSTRRLDPELALDDPKFKSLPVVSAVRSLRQAVTNLEKGGQRRHKRKMSADELVEEHLEATGINVTRVDEPIAAVVNSVEQMVAAARPKNVDRVSFAEQELRATQDLADLTENEHLVGLLTDVELGREAERVKGMADADLAMAEKVANRTQAWRIVLTAHSRELISAGAKAHKASAEDAPRLLAELGAVHARHIEAVRATTGLKAISGRTLGAHRMVAHGYERLPAMLQRSGQLDGLAELAKNLSAYGDNPIEASRLSRLAQRSVNGWQLTMEWWVNSILGGGRTLSINLISGAMVSMWRPFEKMVGSAMAMNMPGIKDAMLDYASYYDTFRMAMSVGWESARKNESRLLGGGKTGEFGRVKAITPEGINEASGGRLNLDGSQGVGKIVKLLGAFFRYPTAVLTGTDDMIKYMNFIASARSIMRRTALADPSVTGLGPRAAMTPAQAAAWAETKVDDLIYRGQVINEEVLYRREMDRIMEGDEAAGLSTIEMQDLAIERASDKWRADDPESILQRLVTEEATRTAQEVTFTKPIPKDGTFSEDITYAVQRQVGKHPALRFFATFIQTPFNILMWARDRTVDPLLGVSKQILSSDLRAHIRKGYGNADWVTVNKTKNRYLREMLGDIDLKGLDPDSDAAKAVLRARREEALGRIGVGIGMSMFFMGLASQGFITGRGPSDKETRDALVASGWRPYSFHIGDSYIEYRRLDPFATILGSIADFFTIGSYAPEDDQSVIDDMMIGMIVSFANNATNKTYMTGIKNLVELATDPARTAPKLLPRFLASFVPTGPTDVINFLAGDHDPMQREIRGVVDAIMQKSIPYYGESKDPVRNVLGEPVKKIKSLGEAEGIIPEFFNMFLPIAYSEVTDVEVRREMAKLKHSFTPPRTVQGGIDLRNFTNARGQSAYDRMLQIRGELKLGGQSIRVAMRKMMRSRKYQLMDPVSTIEVRSPRIDEINRLINKFHRQAVRKMRGEFPDVATTINRIRSERVEARYRPIQDLVR